MIANIIIKSSSTSIRLLKAFNDSSKESTTNLRPSFLLITLNGLKALIALNAFRDLSEEP